MIRTVYIAIKVGFSSAIPTEKNPNPNVVDAIKKWQFLGNQHLQNRLIAAFKRGYYECEKLLRDVKTDNWIGKLKKDVKDEPFKFS